MSIGALELVVIGFEGNKFNGRVAPELDKLQKKGIVRVIDAIFVTKDAKGNTVGVEIDDVDDMERQHFGALTDALRGILTDEDVKTAAEALPNNSSALIILFEHSWAEDFRNAVIASGGKLLVSGRIPADVVDGMEKELEAAIAGGV